MKRWDAMVDGYDFWLIGNNDHVGGDRFVMVASQSNNIIRGHSAFVSTVRQNNGKAFTRPCVFNIPSAGLYNLVLPENQKKQNVC